MESKIGLVHKKEELENKQQLHGFGDAVIKMEEIRVEETGINEKVVIKKEEIGVEEDTKNIEHIYIKEEPLDFERAVEPVSSNLLSKNISDQERMDTNALNSSYTKKRRKFEPTSLSEYSDESNMSAIDEDSFVYTPPPCRKPPTFSNEAAIRIDVAATFQPLVRTSTLNAKLSTQASSTEYETCKRKLMRKEKSLSVSDDINMILCPNGNESDWEMEDDDDNQDETVVVESREQYENLIGHMNDVEVEAYSSGDDIPLTRFAKKTSSCIRNPCRSTEYKWQKVEFQPPEDLIWKDTLVVEDTWFNQPPLFFFNLIFDNNLIQYITQQTNIYAFQKVGTELQLKQCEMNAFLGTLMLTGLVKVPSYRHYWRKGLRIDPIANGMSSQKFEEIKRFIHFNDNANEKPRTHPDFDKLYKIRPVLDAIKTNCKKMSQEEHQSIDEQIIPTKARISFKQYNPKRPHKWGYKVLARAGSSGFVYDFEVYTGKNTTCNVPEVRVALSYVLRLSEGIPKHRNYKVFYDNWFSSVDLAEKLKDEGLLSLSTVRVNRLKKCKLKEDKILQKEGRGSFDHRVEMTSNLIAIKWYDNKAVYCLSSYAGLYPLDTAKRWDNKQKRFIDIHKPYAIKEYNRFMGGVELCDMLMELYQINFKSHKWYMRIFFYLLDLSVVNAWLLYRRVCNSMGQKFMRLYEFKADIALGLLASNASTSKRGRPSNNEINGPKKKIRKSCHPAESVKFDNVGHLPNYATKRYRCKECVKRLTYIMCGKCNVGLCLTKDRNCYTKYHQKQ